ncbi:hypothetical protein F0237_16815 [Vibrio tubiashii]|uniref:BioF2-like acetyltransferase domain-containing protein n=1 Tax=Vibrio tubiashii TaxID=29498 RepID=A0AAE5GSN0_9VIBR|nr:peptidoglycan bridge formation glycyltransferase FemA/FemB family protein [Vibrio tubiashii]NOI82332.1 hypothetical protein [Vibrio tubiashii]
MLTLDYATQTQLEQWDSLVTKSNEGTMFHSLKFLSYHRDRFVESEKQIVWSKGEQLFGVMPTVISELNGKNALLSPYGASFGGPIFRKTLKLREGDEAISALINYLDSNNITTCNLTLSPVIYNEKNSEVIGYCLEKYGFKLVSRDVFSVIGLEGKSYEDVWQNYEGRARTSIRKSKEQFKINTDAEIEEFYNILVEDKYRLNSKPTHTLEQLKYLKSLFPNQVWVDIATHRESGAKAGICYFMPSANTVMTFYMAQETRALKLNGVSVLVDFGIQKAIEHSLSYFDFGGSSIGYEIENIGVANFKESFGAYSVSRPTYVRQR